MEKINNTNNPKEETLLLRLFRLMVEDSLLSEDTIERIRRKLEDKIEKQNN